MSTTDDLIKQILASSNTSRWTGEGFGSAEKNAADMAKILSSIGITDIHQFGKVPQYQQAEVQYGVNGKIAQADEDGNYYIMVPGAPDDEGNPTQVRKNVSKQDLKPIYGFTDPDYGFQVTDQSKVKIVDGKPVVDTGQTTFGNIKTGQAVPNTYSERQKGNFFGGTFAGKGNTGYGVQFDAQGNPIFYTQGASSNDLLNILADNPVLNAAANVAASYFGGPAGVAALQAAQGKPLKDIAKSAAMSYLGGQAGNAVSSVSGLTDVIGQAGTDAVANAAKQFVASGGKADPVQLLMSAGLNYGVNAAGDQLGFKDLPLAQQKMLTTALTGVITKQPLDQLLMNVAMTGAMNQNRASGDQMTATPNPSNLEDFLASIDQYKVDQNAGASGQGYYDETTGKFIQDDLGGLLNPLGADTGNIDPNKQWEYNLVRPGVWADANGNELDMSYLPNSETALTGEEIMRRAGALPSSAGSNIKVPTPKASAGDNLSSLLAAMNGQQQTMQLPSQDPLAHIKLMQDLFGTNVDLTPTDSSDNNSGLSHKSSRDEETSGEDAE